MKSIFAVHSNGEDEWIKVPKRTYDKTIDMFCDEHEAELKAKDERIAELEAKKSCEGCFYSQYEASEICKGCIRGTAVGDHYFEMEAKK